LNSVQVQRSKDYYRLLGDVVDNELAINEYANNKTLWVKMGNELEIKGIEKIRISTIMRKDIEDILYEKKFKEYMPREEYKWHNGNFWVVTKSNGWTDPSMARHVSDPNVDQDNSSINTPNPSMIKLCYDIIEVSKNIIDKSKNIEPLHIVFGKKEMNEFYKQRCTIINNCKNAIDNKTKVPKNTELFLLECLSTVLGSVNKCAQVFMEQNLIRLKEQGKFFTLKQATKFQRGGKQSQLNILKPISRDTALYLNCSGVQCTCGSWNVKDNNNSNDLECYDCGKVLPQGHISKCRHCQVPLYKERLEYMVKHKNKCENCDAENDLPQELVQYAKSK